MRTEQNPLAVEPARRAVGERSAISGQPSAREEVRTTEYTEYTEKSRNDWKSSRDSWSRFWLKGNQNSTQRREGAKTQRAAGIFFHCVLAPLRLCVEIDLQTSRSLTISNVFARPTSSLLHFRVFRVFRVFRGSTSSRITTACRMCSTAHIDFIPQYHRGAFHS